VGYPSRVIERLSSPGFARTALWLSALVLIAGIVAFITVSLGSTDDPTPAAAPASTVDGTDFDPGPGTAAPKESDVPKEAREVAGEFILAAVGREDLEKAWTLAHPSLKRDCGCTKQEWLTGNINVQYYPTDGLQGAAFTVNEVGPGLVVLEVLLTPKQGSEVRPQAFYVGLKQVGGKNGNWLVDYWAPHSAIPVPQQG
jgi:hypothetical protein